MRWEDTGSEALVNLNFLPQELEAHTLDTPLIQGRAKAGRSL